jgi:hypothetical protein
VCSDGQALIDIRTPKGEEVRLHIDTYLRKDAVVPGDAVHVDDQKADTRSLFKSWIDRYRLDLQQSTDQVRVQAGQRFDGDGLNLVIDDLTAYLTQTAKDTLDDHLIAFTDFQLSKTHDL